MAMTMIKLFVVKKAPKTHSHWVFKKHSRGRA